MDVYLSFVEWMFKLDLIILGWSLFAKETILGLFKKIIGLVPNKLE